MNGVGLMEETGENEEQNQRKRGRMSKVWERFKEKKRENTVQCGHCGSQLA